MIFLWSFFFGDSLFLCTAMYEIDGAPNCYLGSLDKLQNLVYTIIFKIFEHFTKFYRSFHSPQVKTNLIPGVRNVIYELPHECPSDLRLKILGNKEII